MNRPQRQHVPSRMKPLTHFALAAALAAIASCAADSGNFSHGASGKPVRKSTGNAPLEGPSAGQVIDQTRYDHERRDYLDRIDNRHRRDRRYY